jgi:hypothetical protein
VLNHVEPSDGVGTLAYPFSSESTYEEGLLIPSVLIGMSNRTGFTNEGFAKRFGIDPEVLLILEQASTRICDNCLYPGFLFGTTVERLHKGFPLEPCFGSVSNPLIPIPLSYEELVGYLNVAAQVDPGLVTQMSIVVGLQLLSQAAVEGVVPQDLPVQFLVELLTRDCPRPNLVQFLNPGDISGNCTWSGPYVVLKDPTGGFYPKTHFKCPLTSEWV